MFYRLWYCVAISQVTFGGIIVELIWSYNSANFFFWLQVYSAYSLYQCLCGILNSRHDADPRNAAAMIFTALSLSYLTSVLVQSLRHSMSPIEIFCKDASVVQLQIANYASESWFT